MRAFCSRSCDYHEKFLDNLLHQLLSVDWLRPTASVSDFNVSTFVSGRNGHFHRNPDGDDGPVYLRYLWLWLDGMTLEAPKTAEYSHEIRPHLLRYFGGAKAVVELRASVEGTENSPKEKLSKFSKFLAFSFNFENQISRRLFFCSTTECFFISHKVLDRKHRKRSRLQLDKTALDELKQPIDRQHLPSAPTKPSRARANFTLVSRDRKSDHHHQRIIT